MERSLKAFEIRPHRPETNFETTIINTPIPPALWECVVSIGQIFIYEEGDNKIFYKVCEIKKPTDRKWDMDVVLTSHQTPPDKKLVRASALCGSIYWRRLPDLDPDETYLLDAPDSSATRIGLGPSKSML